MNSDPEKKIKSFDDFVEKAINFLYISTLIASISINIFDIFRLIELSESFILFTNVPAIFIILVSFLLKITNIISLKTSFTIVVFTILANSIFSIFQSRYLEDIIISLLRESIFIAFLVSLSAFVVSRRLAYYITAIFCFFIVVLYFNTRDSYLLENVPVLVLIFIGYTIFINYLIYLIEQTLHEVQGKNMIIKEQLEEIRAQNEELIQLNEELHSQREILEQKNEELNNKNIEITLSRNELKKLNEAKNKLFTVIGHDIKNPMHIVIGYSRLLLSRFNKMDDQKKKEYIERIDKTINGLYDMLDNLLTWSKTQLDSISYNPEILDMNHIISLTIELYQELINKKSVNILFTTDQDLTVYADKNMIKVIIRNLIDNAVKFTGSNGVISISGNKNTQFVTLNISNNGSAIPKEIEEILFELNEEKSRPGTQGEKGSGFGLVICKEFVEKNFGKIWFKSDQDKGTIFSISLPRQKQ